jgi:dynactin complex subunit
MKRKYVKFIVILCFLILIISIDYFTPRSSASAGNSLRSQMMSYSGIEKNDETILHSIACGDKTVKIFEKIDFNIEHNGYKKYSFFESDRINEYCCYIIITRYATINEDEQVYNTTTKEIAYLGYEDNDPNSIEEAYVDPETEKCSYSENDNYFNDFSKQAYDACYYFTIEK